MSTTKEKDSNSHKLKRSLQARHLNMIAMGGAIGTGIFLALGATIKQAGPLFTSTLKKIGVKSG